MNDTYRRSLVAMLSTLDRMATEAQAILNEPGDTELLPWAEELRETIVEMQAKVEAKLDAALNASGQLWGALYDVGNEEVHVPQIPQPIIDKLIEFKFVEIVDGQRRLTAYGQKAYMVMESGDGEILELE